MKKNSLGRGLQSLIPKKPALKSGLAKGWLKQEQTLPQAKESIFNVEVNKIKPNPFQPRQGISKQGLKDLAASIREHGVLQPLIVSKIEKSTKRGQDVEYELIAGERRWRAAKMARLPHVPVIIRGTSANKKLEVALVENIQRQNLNALEAALAYKQLQDRFGLNQGEIARKVGKERTTISNALRLLTLPQEVQGALASDKISEGHGRAVLMAQPKARLALFRNIVKNSLNVRQAEERARKLALGSKVNKPGPKIRLFKVLEKDLEEVIGRRISITQRDEVGHLRIEFVSRPELDSLVQHLLQFKKK